MNRRAFITLLGGAAAAWPLAARAQQPAMPVIGFLSGQSRDTSGGNVVAFSQGLSEAGYVQGRNVTIEFRWAENRYDRLPALAADLVGRQVAVIVTAAGGSTPAALAAKVVTTTIPIVFVSGGDPVKFGLVTSLNRPGGNVTGVSWVTDELGAKRLALLHQLLPQATVIAALLNPNFPDAADQLKDLEEAARTLGLKLLVFNASTESEIDTNFAILVQQHPDALFLAGDPFFSVQLDKIIALTAHHRLPATYSGRDSAAAGGLMSYGASSNEAHRQAGLYTGKILKGAKPADLPVLLPTKFELVINRKTAKALGLEIPPTLLALADEVIE
jgi:putative ABC transport system substrate-binding protein